MIAHYRILRPLGAGGMGQVFLAEDQRLDRQVALKLLPSELATDPARRQRFITEAKAASALNHPNVCIIHEVGETEDGRLFIAMEFIEGETLDARARQGSPSIEEIVSMGVQVADALDAAHAKGIVHRDIKPSNISLNARGQIKVLDFGLAKRTTLQPEADPDESTKLQTRTGQVLGTPHYMSPEQALGREVDPRCDIFSLGVVLYELATLRSPFAGQSLADTLDRILHTRPEPIARFNNNATPDFERIVAKCLEKQADRRYQSARELLVDLRNLQRELHVGNVGSHYAALAVPALQLPSPVPIPMNAARTPTAPAQEMKDSDVLITYASIDDQPILHGRQGWVSQFYRNLEVRLEQLSGDRVKIWPLPNSPGTGAVDQRVLECVPGVKTLVSVISPPFLKSEGCRQEVETFWHTAERAGCLRIENKSRLFKVVKTPVDPRELPPQLSGMFKQLLDYEFYDIDPVTGRFHEFSEEFGEEARRVFLERIYDLAYEIAQVLKSWKHTPAARGLPSASLAAPKVIYLAEATSDLKTERDRIRRELQERGFEVLPDAPLPMDRDELQEAVKRHLQRANAVIHLVGSRYGVIPEGCEESLAALQARLSAELFGSKKSGRFIWSPPGLRSDDPRQAEFIRSLHENSLGMAGTELLSGSVEQLKGLVIKHLTAPPPTQPHALESAGGIKRIYLICDSLDESATEPIADYLYDQGFEVKVPIFEGEEESVVEVHQENLKVSDAVLIYFGEATPLWVEMKLMDLLKAPGYGRTKPWLAQAIYVAPPNHHRKDRFRTRTAEVIRESAGFEPGLLESFMRRARSNDTNQGSVGK